MLDVDLLCRATMSFCVLRGAGRSRRLSGPQVLTADATWLRRRRMRRRMGRRRGEARKGFQQEVRKRPSI